MKSVQGQPVIAADTNGNTYFKRFRCVADNLIVLESLESSGIHSPVVLSAPGGASACLEKVWPVAVCFSKYKNFLMPSIGSVFPIAIRILYARHRSLMRNAVQSLNRPPDSRRYVRPRCALNPTRDARIAPWSRSGDAPGACRSSAGSRRARAHAKRSCAEGHESAHP